MHNTDISRSYEDRITKLSATQKQALARKLSLSPDIATAKLQACITTVRSEAIDSKELKRFAQQSLPEHFVPQLWQQVQAMPRTPIGKINRQHAQHFAWQTLATPEVPEVNDVSSGRAKAGTNKARIEEDDDDFDIFGDNAYIAPTNDIEIILAKIWTDVLGSGDISIHDEFLEVGGDSLLSIRILARINKAGLNIATEDFFEHPTIAGQAKAISKASENSYEQGSTKGKFALIPIQNWFFERIQIDLQHWNQSVLLAVDDTLDFPSLERAFQKVIMQHDALRIAFSQPADTPNNELQDESKDPSLNEHRHHFWQQEYLSISTQLAIDCIDISGQDEQQQADSIELHCQAINRSMELPKGNLARLAFFQTGVGNTNKVVMVIHHLIIDAESWHIVLEDLQSCWLSYAQGNTPTLPRKTSSFKHWSEKLHEYAQSDLLQEQAEYWQAQTSQAKLPRDFATASAPNTTNNIDSEVTNANTAITAITENTVGSGDVLTSSLNKEQTTTLLQDLPKKIKVDVKDVLITALVIAIQEWSQNEQVLLDIEGHGRENLFEKIDISRTVGWFTSVFPVLFNVDASAPYITTLLSVNSTLSAVPQKGIGHGLLHTNSAKNRGNAGHVITGNSDTNENLQQQPYSEICFNYLGQVDTQTTSNNTAAITQIASNIGQTRSPKCLRAFLVEVNAKVEAGQLIVDWSYSHAVHKTDTLASVISNFTRILSDLLSLDTPETIEQGDTDLFDLIDLESDDLAAIAKALSGDN